MRVGRLLLLLSGGFVVFFFCMWPLPLVAGKYLLLLLLVASINSVLNKIGTFSRYAFVDVRIGFWHTPERTERNFFSICGRSSEFSWKKIWFLVNFSNFLKTILILCAICFGIFSTEILKRIWNWSISIDFQEYGWRKLKLLKKNFNSTW